MSRIVDHRLSRREFIKTTLLAGIAVKVGFLQSEARAATAGGGDPAQDWWSPQTGIRHRIDAIDKVTGGKVFSRDYRSRDLPGWPQEQSHAFIIRATKADRAFDGIDLSVLGADLQPDRVVLAEDLKRDGIKVPNPDYYGDAFLLESGETPYHLGHPVALLIYRDFARYDAAKRLVKFDDSVVRYGAETGHRQLRHYAAARYVRIEGETSDGKDRHSATQNGPINGKFDGDKVNWVDADNGLAVATEIAEEMARAETDEASLVLKRDYFIPFYDASAMETDNGNVWYDAGTRTLHLTFATQSPHRDALVIAGMMAGTGFAVDNVDAHFGDTVGYGTKDTAVFPLYCVLAGLYGEGRPVRLANDRFEQFQSGLKAHAFTMKNALVVDRASARFKAMTADFTCHAGGRSNVTPNVARGSMRGVQSAYYLPKSDISVVALASRAVEAGSTRGYGCLQGICATEMLVDEAADLSGLDPIEFRQRNAFRIGQRGPQGDIWAGTPRNEEILARAKAHPLWTARAERKASFEAQNPGKKYGVGFAIGIKNYGGGPAQSNGTASLLLSSSGELSMRHVVHELGTGANTSQSVVVANILGKPPERNAFAVIDWPELPLYSKVAANAEEKARLEADPRYTRNFAPPMSASNSVHAFCFATEQAALALLRLSLWPAALALWAGKAGTQALRFEDVRMGEGKLVAPGLEPLSIEQLAAKAHALGLVTGVTLHTFRTGLVAAEADFDVPGAGTMRLKADAFAVRYGDGASEERKALMKSGGFHFIERSNLAYPPPPGSDGPKSATYSSKGILIEVAVNTTTGVVDVLSHHSILDCGRQVVPQLVSGQIQGGVAMGIGFALHEYLPAFEDGPGDGTWNWNRYHLPHASEVAVWHQTEEVLPPVSDDEPPKGIAEVTTIAAIPACANAVAHALGKRFYEFPISPDKIRQAMS